MSLRDRAGLSPLPTLALCHSSGRKWGEEIVRIMFHIKQDLLQKFYASCFYLDISLGSGSGQGTVADGGRDLPQSLFPAIAGGEDTGY